MRSVVRTPALSVCVSNRQHVCVCKALAKLEHEPMHLKLRVHMASTARGQLQLWGVEVLHTRRAQMSDVLRPHTVPTEKRIKPVLLM